MAPSEYTSLLTLAVAAGVSPAGSYLGCNRFGSCPVRKYLVYAWRDERRHPEIPNQAFALSVQE